MGIKIYLQVNLQCVGCVVLQLNISNLLYGAWFIHCDAFANVCAITCFVDILYATVVRGILLGSYYKILGHLTSIFFVHYRLEDWRSTWRGSMPLSTGCLTSLVVHLYVCHVKLLNFLILSFLFSTSQLLLLTHYNSLGLQAPKPSSGPHKSRECLPLILVLRNRLKYALTYREVIAILMQRHVLVDGKVRTDKTYPAGFMGMWTSLFASNLIFFSFFGNGIL